MRKFRYAVLMGIMCLGVTACGGEDPQRAAGTVPEAAETAAATASNAAGAEAEASKTETEAESIAEKENESSAEVQGIYADMDGIVFGFYSGVGAWETMLEVAPDGSFKGQFFDANMGETGEGYDNGTIYECAFTGKFSKAEKVDDTSYSAKVEELNYEKEKDGSDQYIEEKTLHIMTEPYGLGLGDEIIIYTPDKKISELSEGFMSWMTWKLPEDAETLGGIGIYNVTGDYVFYPDSYAMGNTGDEGTGETADLPVKASGESTAYTNLKNAYYNQAMPEYYRTPYVPVPDEAPKKPYQSVTMQNLQGRWVNRYTEAGSDFVEVLSVNGDRGRIETFRDGVQEGVWNGEGTISIEDRSDRNVCPAFRITDDEGTGVCTIYIRWVNDNAFFDGGFLNEWKREGTAEPDQYLYDTVTMENLQGVWYTETAESDGLHQVVLTVDEDRAILFETVNGEASKFWNGGGHAELTLQSYSSGTVYPELIIQEEHGPSMGGSAGIYISSVGQDSFYDCGYGRWYVKVAPGFLLEDDLTPPEETELKDDGSAEINGSYHYVVTPGENRTEAGSILDWTVEVTGSEGLKETLNVSVDDISIYFPPANEIVWETDVNFDGLPDVLLYRGTLGAQGADYYDCWISDGKTLNRCKDFEEIPNPYVDTASKMIYGHIRDGAAAFYELSYRIEGNKAIMTEEIRYVYDEEKEDYVPEEAQ